MWCESISRQLAGLPLAECCTIRFLCGPHVLQSRIHRCHSPPSRPANKQPVSQTVRPLKPAVNCWPAAGGIFGKASTGPSSPCCLFILLICVELWTGDELSDGLSALGWLNCVGTSCATRCSNEFWGEIRGRVFEFSQRLMHPVYELAWCMFLMLAAVYHDVLIAWTGMQMWSVAWRVSWQ